MFLAGQDELEKAFVLDGLNGPLDVLRSLSNCRVYSPMTWLKRLLTPPLIFLAALLMGVEEWLWERLKWLTGWVARFPPIRWYEAAILRLPPYPMMVVFLLPATILIPVKLLAVYWLTQGYWLLSLVLILGAKLLGTAIVARSYVICHPKLMAIDWFRRLHDWLIATRDRLYAAVKAMPLYQAVRDRLSALKEAARRILRKWRGRRGLWARWRAIRRWHRRTRTPRH